MFNFKFRITVEKVEAYLIGFTFYYFYSKKIQKRIQVKRTCEACGDKHYPKNAIVPIILIKSDKTLCLKCLKCSICKKHLKYQFIEKEDFENNNNGLNHLYA